MKHADQAAEKAILANLIQGGKDAYFEVVDLVADSSVFSKPEHAYIFSCIKHAYSELELDVIDLTSILSSANSLGIPKMLSKSEKYIQELSELSVNFKNLRNFAKKVKRLQAIRIIKGELSTMEETLDKFTGDEPISKVFGAIEEPIFGLSTRLTGIEEEVKRLPNLIEDYMKEKIKNPVESVGISSGFPYYDAAIGSGFCGGDLHVIAARMKNYKSVFALTVANHMASIGVKAFIMDTELLIKQQLPRLISMNSGVPYDEIRTGKFAKDPEKLDKIRASYKLLVEHEFIDWVSIAAMPFEEQLSVLRRWYYKTVNSGDPCCIIYDYLKVGGAAGREANYYQELGYMTTCLKDFAGTHDIPMLALCQRSRTNNSDSELSVGDSDQIARFASSLSIFRKKEQEEIDRDGPQLGNQLLTVSLARDGGGTGYDYINYQVDGSIMSIRELGYKHDMKKPEENPIKSKDEKPKLTLEF